MTAQRAAGRAASPRRACRALAACAVVALLAGCATTAGSGDGPPWRTAAGEGAYAVRFNYTGQRWWHADVQPIPVATRAPIAVLPMQYTANGEQPGAFVNGRHVGRLWNTLTQQELASRLRALGFHVLEPTIQMYGENLAGFQGLEHFIAGVHKGNAHVQTVLLTADAHDPNDANPKPGAQMLVTGTQPRLPAWEQRIQARIAPFYGRTGLGNLGPRVRGGQSMKEGSSSAWHPLIERAAEYGGAVAILEAARAIDIERAAGSIEAGRSWAAGLFDGVAEGMADHACAVGFDIPHCTAAPPEKRHSAAEIAGYVPASFSAPIASSEGARREREKSIAAIRAVWQRVQAQPERAAGDAAAAVAEAVWAVAFHDTDHEIGRALLQAALRAQSPPLPQRPLEVQRALLAAAYMLDAAGSAPLIQAAIPQLATPREFAIAAYTLLRADGSAAQRSRLSRLLQQRADRSDPRLIALQRALDRAPPPMPRPPLADLLAAPFTRGLPVVYSLQRTDRRHIGLAIVRGSDGRFVRASDGRPFAIPHLALALTGLPGTLTNGNTPQGLFTIVGAGTASNAWIGPTPYLESKLPVEATLAEFSHAPVAGAWTEAHYEAWLPPSWRSHLPFKEAWLAGLAGRTEMLLHGTTIDAQAYRTRPWFPGTPSAGCLVALEQWSATDGLGLRSDQLSLAQAFMRGGQDRGYLVVVEIDDGVTPVQLDEVLADLVTAERRPQP